MELKVWVDGVQRVVCGLSKETSCQDVVIALAQAIGQTGRYVLVQKLRDTERQLVADERPLESLSKLGQLSSEVQFILRRTGPTTSEGSDLDRPPSFLGLQEPELPKRKEPKKALTFNLGPNTSPQTRIKHFKKVPKDSPELRAPPVPPQPQPQTQSGPSKEEIFRQVLQQQSRLQALQAQVQTVEQQVWVMEQPPPPVLSPDLLEEMDTLGQAFRCNEAELAHGEYWESEYLAEVQREQNMLTKLKEIHAALDHNNRRIHEAGNQRGRLERDVHLQAENRKNGIRQGQVTTESLGQARGQLDTVLRQGSELDSSLKQTEHALKKAEELLQDKTKELDELNKELRQCNLQQFIQQTGPPAPPSFQPDDPDMADQTPDGQSDEDSNPSVLEFNPRTTAKQILGNPRSLQNPLVSSLHPEVVSAREVSWR